MQGRRVAGDTSAFDLAEGDYALRSSRRQFAARLPGGDQVTLPVAEGAADPRPLSDGGTWGFTEHEDGTITITPSIDAHGEHPWHGHLVQGVWSP